MPLFLIALLLYISESFLYFMYFLRQSLYNVNKPSVSRATPPPPYTCHPYHHLPYTPVSRMHHAGDPIFLPCQCNLLATPFRLCNMKTVFHEKYIFKHIKVNNK